MFLKHLAAGICRDTSTLEDIAQVVDLAAGDIDIITALIDSLNTRGDTDTAARVLDIASQHDSYREHLVALAGLSPSPDVLARIAALMTARQLRGAGCDSALFEQLWNVVSPAGAFELAAVAKGRCAQMAAHWLAGQHRPDLPGAVMYDLAGNGDLVAALAEVDPTWHLVLIWYGRGPEEPDTAAAAVAAISVGAIDEAHLAATGTFLAQADENPYTSRYARDMRQLLSRLTLITLHADETFAAGVLGANIACRAVRYRNIGPYLANHSPGYVAELITTLQLVGRQTHVAYTAAHLLAAYPRQVEAIELLAQAGNWPGAITTTQMNPTTATLTQLTRHALDTILDGVSPTQTQQLIEHLSDKLAGNLDELTSLAVNWEGTLAELVASITAARQ